MNIARRKIGFLIAGEEQTEITQPIHEQINTTSQAEVQESKLLLTPWHTELRERIMTYENAVADIRFKTMPKKERDDMINELDLFIRLDTQLLMGYQQRA